MTILFQKIKLYNFFFQVALNFYRNSNLLIRDPQCQPVCDSAAFDAELLKIFLSSVLTSFQMLADAVIKRGK